MASIKEVEMTEEENNATLRKYENDIIGGLLEAASFATSEQEAVPVEIARRGVVLIKFSIRPLSEDEYSKCRKRHTTQVRNKQLGITMPGDTDVSAYRSALIYAATVEADKERVWNNKEVWKKLDVLSGEQVISRVLKAGEKDAVCSKIDEISGFNATAEELAKN